MAIIERTREIKTKSRQSTGGFKIDCEGITKDDTLKITITHADFPDFKKKYLVEGIKLVGKNSISFKVVQTGKEVRISWQGNILPKIDLS
jgi:hypothetical protein